MLPVDSTSTQISNLEHKNMATSINSEKNINDSPQVKSLHKNEVSEYMVTATAICRPETDQEIKEELDEMGIDVLEPKSKKEQTMAQALDAFSLFVLEEEKEMCQEIINKHIGKSAGELQGGNDEHEIYRIVIADDDDEEEGEAADEMFEEFYSSRQGKRYRNVLTIQKLKQYMLGMCERGSQARYCDTKYRKLGNLMFILSFGPLNGQVRHIDNMDPNLQICLYMSPDCPSTIVYSMDEPQITSCKDLVEYWGNVPELVDTILKERGDTPLTDQFHTKFFAFWDTINANLMYFGKLYQPVSLQLSLQTDPGTTLLVGGNEVHAGPPTVGPRMFAFAIGIPDEDENQTNQIKSEAQNNSEVQYSPVLLHVDLCCILFSIADFEYSERQDEHKEAKQFLLNILLTLAKDYPKETYARLIGDDRSEVREWLGKLVTVIKDPKKVNLLIQEAIESQSIFYSPDVLNSKKRRAKKKKKKRSVK